MDQSDIIKEEECELNEMEVNRELNKMSNEGSDDQDEEAVFTDDEQD